MNQKSSLSRKIVYLCLIVVLSFPMIALGRLRTAKDRGGVIAQQRESAGLLAGDLGEIDPASETMRLATFGLRGIAVNLLWDRAMEYKRNQDYDRLSVVLQQIARLQPHFGSVWEFQAHNLSYNCSVEFDDFRQRYDWVTKGLYFLGEGIDKNRADSRLVWYMGHIVGHKIGQSDERIQFRRLFGDDRRFHDWMRSEGIDVDATLINQKPDNWLASREWHLKSEVVADGGENLRGKNAVIFYSGAPMAHVNAAQAFEENPLFDEDVARERWSVALRDMDRYGDLLLPQGDYAVKLNDLDRYIAQRSALEAELDAIVPGERKRQVDIRVTAMPEYLQVIYNMPSKDRNRQQQFQFSRLGQELRISPDLIAKAAPTGMIVQARELARQVNIADGNIMRIEGARSQSNYYFWRNRCEAERTEVCARARKLSFEAAKLFEDAKLEEARTKFEEAFTRWGKVFDEFPRFFESAQAEEVFRYVKEYVTVLNQLDLRRPDGTYFDEDFPLADLVVLQGMPTWIGKSKKRVETGAAPVTNASTPTENASSNVAPDDSATKPEKESKASESSEVQDSQIPINPLAPSPEGA